MRSNALKQRIERPGTELVNPGDQILEFHVTFIEFRSWNDAIVWASRTVFITGCVAERFDVLKPFPMIGGLTVPMIVSRTGRMPTSSRTLRLKLVTLCLKKNHR
ncbi:hypothetical protein [Bradyrhizobium sp. CCGUVB23]|uniref:hypothetical protein n=1 Tax=Bradyrhizobium sp. CCGUVB23 TaxID=2949630 RepID=UPI0020B45E8D|nr:hypothetical protein [Bradyrhizobium sp. CCGUVB23]MCP3463333.1 hypothetical protein [Bradyrhizobium sp. CCGUVB23]